MQLSNKELGKRITTLWDEISDDPRDPKVVEFIRLLREFGKRDEVEAFALMDGLGRNKDYERWLMARVAIAGGWALRDPAEASKALFEHGSILPNNFPSAYPSMSAPSQIAILRQASEIFKSWSLVDQEEAQSFASTLPKDQATKELRRMFFKHSPNIEGYQHATQRVDRSSIDAILNNPLRTSSDSTFGREIHGNVLSEGEQAFTFEEWAARNPELARETLQSAIDSPPHMAIPPIWRRNYLRGLARIEPNYLGILELAPPEERLQMASDILYSMSTPDDEMVWQLDGRESSWTLNLDQRIKAMQTLIAEGNFSSKERAELESKMNGERTAADFIQLPELPNKTTQ